MNDDPPRSRRAIATTTRSRGKILAVAAACRPAAESGGKRGY
jgi:hypothetical protein